MALLRAGGLLVACVLTVSAPVSAQAEHRIWGRVQTSGGDVHEGFLRWDRNEGSWVDQLDGSKAIPAENYAVWLAANELERATRSLDLLGYRVSWNEEDPDFRTVVTSGVRFGHLAALAVAGVDSVRLELRSGQRVSLSGGATDIGRSIRDVVVDVPQGREVELDWRDLDRIDFSAPPGGVAPRSPRLHGTVEDIHGDVYSGFIAWDLDEIFESDILDGEEMEGRDERDVRFADIRSIERIERGSRVELTDGQVIDLTGSNDVHFGHGGVQISDPALGMVEVDWRVFRRIRFHAPPDGGSGAGYDTFDGGHPLVGTVETREGETLEGLIRWDADEASSWEILNGEARDIKFSIDFGFVSRIERDPAFGAIVTLRDGRVLHLDHSNDVNWDNRGIMVAPEGSRPERVASWRLVSWGDFHSATFRPSGAGSAGEAGSVGEAGSAGEAGRE